jgi:hypothetical protein
MKHLSPVSYLQVCNNEVIDLPDTLSWDISHMDSIINYQIQIDNDVTFSSCEVNDILVFLQDTTSADTMYSVILGNLPGSNSLVEGKKYYWRVKPNYTFGLPTTFTDPAPYFYYVYVSTINEPIDAQIPKEYALYQNYPNPFNPVTRIKYALPKSTRVKIWLYDIIGRRIKVLVDDQKPAGYHTLEFNGGNLASGIYMYRIHADNFISTKKMLLIK